MVIFQLHRHPTHGYISIDFITLPMVAFQLASSPYPCPYPSYISIGFITLPMVAFQLHHHPTHGYYVLFMYLF